MKEKQPFLLKRFIPYMGKLKILLPLSLLFSGMAAVMSNLPFVFIWMIIRKILASPENFAMQQISFYAWAVGLTALSGIIIYFFALSFSHLAAFRVEVGLQKIGMEKILNMPLGFFDTVASGKIRKIINDSASTTHSFLAHQLPDLSASFITPITLLVMILAVNWKLGMISLIPLALGTFIFTTMMTKKGKKFMDLYFSSLEDMSKESVEYVRGIPVVKTFGQSVFSFTKFYDSIIKYKNYVNSYALLWKYKMSFFNVLLHSTAFFLIPAALIFLSNGGNLNLLMTDFIFYLIITPNFMNIIMKSAYFRENAYSARQALDRIEGLLEYSQLEYGNKKLSHSAHDLEFADVYFKYKGAEKNALDGISFKVKQGETLALVGASGSGKTTLARLAARFWDVDKGKVLLGGVDVKTISQKELMTNVSFVFQHTSLFSKSLKDNIIIGNKNASPEKIQEALELSQSNEIIDRLPDGLDTMIGTRGTYLSGGEQQRISLARAILKDAPIVLLDEATAFADPENEQQITQVFKELSKGKTTIMIAHRLTTVKNADRILLLSKGKIAEQGSHEELMKQNGIYANMYAEYQESIKWELSTEPTGN